MINSPALFLALLILTGTVGPAGAQTRLSDYVRPLVGTKGQEGNTYPGPSAPFGMIQISPDTVVTNWDMDSGYGYEDRTILGFSLTHLTGTGCPDLGDFLFMPQVGTPASISGDKDHPGSGYQSVYSHADETATAGYYRVLLQKSGVTAELTAGDRAGMLRFRFPASSQASIITDLSHLINGVAPSCRIEFSQRIGIASPGKSCPERPAILIVCRSSPPLPPKRHVGEPDGDQ